MHVANVTNGALGGREFLLLYNIDLYEPRPKDLVDKYETSKGKGGYSGIQGGFAQSPNVLIFFGTTFGSDFFSIASFEDFNS